MTQDVAREAEWGHLEAAVLSLLGLGIGIDPAVRGLAATTRCRRVARGGASGQCPRGERSQQWLEKKREGDERRVERRRRDIASGCLLALSFLDKVVYL
jgi:hypothetical protein